MVNKETIGPNGNIIEELVMFFINLLSVADGFVFYHDILKEMPSAIRHKKYNKKISCVALFDDESSNRLTQTHSIFKV